MRLPTKASRAAKLPRFHPVVAMALLAAGCSYGTLPALPDPEFESFAPPVREQLLDAWKAASATPRDARLARKLGESLFAFGELASAAQCFERSRALDPNAFDTTYLLGAALADLGRDEQALAALREAVAMRPADVPASLRLADILERSGEQAASRDALAAVLEISPGNAAAHYRLGRLAALDPQAAIVHLEKALESEPDYREALYALAGAYRAVGLEDDASAHLARFEAADPTPRRHYADPLMDALAALRTGTAQQSFDDGRALQDNGDLTAARAAYETVLEIDPGYAQAHVNLVAVHGLLGNHDEVARHYARAVELDPSVAEAHYNFGVSRHLAADFRAAADAFAKAVDLNPQNADAHGNLGTALEELGRIQEAERHYRLALEHDPSHPKANFHWGKRLASGGRRREAVPYLETALERESPATGLPALLLALVHRELGDAGKAREFAQTALEQARASGNEPLATRIEADLVP